jgi:hypothetical protein
MVFSVMTYGEVAGSILTWGIFLLFVFAWFHNARSQHHNLRYFGLGRGGAGLAW